MRILHVHSGNLYGGVETVLLSLAKGQSLVPELDFHFALAFSGPLLDRLRAIDHSVQLLGPARISRPWTVWKARRKLRATLKVGKFHAVILHSMWSMVVFGPEVRRKRIPLVYWQHDTLSGNHWLEIRAKSIRPDLIIANSLYNKTTTSKVYDLEPIVLYSPIIDEENNFVNNNERKNRLRLQNGAHPHDVVIIQVSRMEEWKGHKLHLNALSEIRLNPKWTCWMVGGPQRLKEEKYFERLKRLTKENGLTGRINWLGQIRDVHSLLEAADIFCQPNVAPEPFGLTFIEALKARLPVVATSLGGAKEIVTKDCGILTPPGDAESLSMELHRLIQSSDLRKRLGECGPDRARKLCDPETQLQKLENILSNCFLVESH